MRCPDCKQAMIILEYRGVELDFCPGCKGCWLDEGELEQILHSRDEAMRLLNDDAGRTGARRCPRCGAKMQLRSLPPDGPELDVCPAACGIWFDQGELRAAVQAHLPAGAAGEMVQTLTEMFGTTENTKEQGVES